MAENIVREESREYPERRSRLNDAKEIQDVLENNKGTDTIRGITFNPNPKEFGNKLFLSAFAYQNMSNLRFLKIEPLQGGTFFKRKNTVHCPKGLKPLCNELRYFKWSGYPLKSFPQGFTLKELVEIHMPFSRVVKLWEGVQDLMNLKIMSLSYSTELKELPDFSMAQNLEVLDLERCYNLCSIHPSVFSLPKLVSLNLAVCLNLKNLHSNNHLKSLKNLTLSRRFRLKGFLLPLEVRRLDLFGTGIKTLKLPIGQFNKLEALYLGGPHVPLKSFQINELRCLTSLKIFSLKQFTEEIDKSKLVILFDAWRCLEEFCLQDCVVPEIPDNISGLSFLKILSLRNCRVHKFATSIKHLLELREIDLGHCYNLSSLPELPPSITQLYVEGCTSLKTVDFKLMPAAINSCEVRVCYSGRTIPKGFRYSQIGGSSITIELAPPSSDHLLGFLSCCISLPSAGSGIISSVIRKFRFEDEEINYKDEKELLRRGALFTDIVFVWYDPMESILKGTQRRRYVEGPSSKFTCEFVIEDRYTDYKRVEGCGIWPIYASELQELQQFDWDLRRLGPLSLLLDKN